MQVPDTRVVGFQSAAAALVQHIRARQQRATVEESVGPGGGEAGDLRRHLAGAGGEPARWPRPRCRCPRWRAGIPARRPARSRRPAPASQPWRRASRPRGTGRTPGPRASIAQREPISQGYRGCPTSASRWPRTCRARRGREDVADGDVVGRPAHVEQPGTPRCRLPDHLVDVLRRLRRVVLVVLSTTSNVNVQSPRSTPPSSLTFSK